MRESMSVDDTAVPASEVRTGPTVGIGEDELTDERLTASLAETVLASPGVVRIEPDLEQALADLLRPDPASPGDRVGVSHGSDGRLHVSVDLVVDPTPHPALTTVTILHERLLARIRALGLTPGTVSIAVLALESPVEVLAGSR